MCALIGNANVGVPIETLENVKANALDETVRERAAWAISRLSCDRGGWCLKLDRYRMGIDIESMYAERLWN